MSGWAVMWREAVAEFRAGLHSGIVPLIFIGLTLYLLMCLTNAGYVEKMGGGEVPRNAASLIYLMASGCMFFLFFAWAWVFARPLLRDRSVFLHEVVLALPVNLKALLWGRYLGAVLLAVLLSASILVGFLVTPVLEWLSLVPDGAIGPVPWMALGFAFLWLLVPAACGLGALYFLAALRGRGLAAPFAVAAGLMLLWMFAVVVLKEGHINPVLGASIDPSLFTHGLQTVEGWGPAQKTTGLLPLDVPLLINRALWCLLPLLALAWALARTGREDLALERTARQQKVKKAALLLPAGPRPPALDGTGRLHWGRALLTEAAWQAARLLRGRAFRAGVLLLLALGVLSAFIHVVWHGEGPMVPRLELSLPLLKSAIFLVIAFAVAALAGLLARADDLPGFGEMLDAAPAPDYVRLFGRALAVLAVTLVLSLLPGLSGLIVALLAAPWAAVDPGFALSYPLLMLAPPLLELAMLALLLHAICRRAGLAYAASMLLTFFLVLNHELELVSFPLAEMGIAPKASLSGLTGWGPWLSYLLALDGFKLALCLLLVALAGLALPRGTEERRLSLAGARLRGPVGLAGVVALLLLAGIGLPFASRLDADDGGHSRHNAELEGAAWERQWTADLLPLRVAGGDLRLTIDPASRLVRGEWRLEGVQGRRLDAELPHGFQLQAASIGGQPVPAKQVADHLILELGDCTDCSLELRWTVQVPQWSAEGEPTWLTRAGLWLRESDIVPRLGLDPARLLRAALPRQRQGLPADIPSLPAVLAVSAAGLAPTGNWRWQLVQGENLIGQGRTSGPLAFAALWAPGAITQRLDGVEISHDASRSGMVPALIQDVEAMRACVGHWLGAVPPVTRLAQWPRGLGQPARVDDLLLLAEAPGWDVADQGMGRRLRRVEIATALARAELLARSDLRQGPGSVWLADGVAGAIGLACVRETDGADAFAQVLARQQEKARLAVAGSDVPVGPLDRAAPNGWASAYAPLAALDWLDGQGPGGITRLLDLVRQGATVPAALETVLGREEAARLLAAPRLQDKAVTNAAATGAGSSSR
jgi:hypothetical protein